MSDPNVTKLNDVDVVKFASLAEKIHQEPHVANSKWFAEVRWKGGLCSEATIRDFAPSKSDEPEQIGGTNTGPNPVEQVLGALGNCLAVGYAANATIAGIEIKNLIIRVDGDLDLHTFLGLKDGNAGFSGITASVEIKSDATPDALKALHEKVVGTSPVGHTLSRAVPLAIRLV